MPNLNIYVLQSGRIALELGRLPVLICMQNSNILKGGREINHTKKQAVIMTAPCQMNLLCLWYLSCGLRIAENTSIQLRNTTVFSSVQELFIKDSIPPLEEKNRKSEKVEKHCTKQNFSNFCSLLVCYKRSGVITQAKPFSCRMSSALTVTPGFPLVSRKPQAPQQITVAVW